jgi:uncharacterized membrane protein (Fun14 family)
MSGTDSNSVKPRFPAWVKVMLLGAVALMATGLIVPLVTHSPPPANSVGTLSSSLATSDSTPSSGASWSPAVFKLGFSFFVGFVVAYALRWFLKVALLAAGFMALLLFGLQYAGMVDIKWGAMEKQYDAGSGWVSRQTESFTSFVTGALPSAGAAAVGLFAGVRRKT